MKILVTGASGMVGSFLVAELENRGHVVKEFSIEQGKNVLNKTQVSVEMQNIDVVIHLAGIIEDNNPELWLINVEGTKNVVEEAIKAQVKKVIFLSSTGVYGNNRNEINEESKISPKNNYEKSKIAGEKIVLSHQEELEVCVVRSALILGPNNYWKGLFKLVEKKYPLPCNGKNGFQVIYVKDLVDALITVMNNGLSGETYLAAGEKGKTLNNFYEEIQNAMGMKKKVKHIPTLIALLVGKMRKMKLLTRENVRHLSKDRKYNTEKLEKLGWSAKYSMEKAIVETIEDIKEK